MTLTQKTLIEFGASCIPPTFANLNFKSVTGPEIYDFLCYSEELERLNAGKLAKKWIDRYSHCEEGGWWASGLDPFTDWRQMEWGCFKPDTPKLDYRKPGKVLKYEHPAKTETRVFFLRVTFALGSRIAEKLGFQEEYAARVVEAYATSQKVERSETKGQGFKRSKKGRFWNQNTLRRISRREQVATPSDKWLENTEDRRFWAWVIDNPRIPLIICEGAKKAQCLLVMGYVAIALPGIFSGYRSKDKQGNKIPPHLIPDLKVVAQKGRPVYFCYDNDTKQSTIRDVNIATNQTGRLLQAEGCSVNVISLPGPEKGVDDFIFAQGVEAFDHLFKTALPLAAWQVRLLRQLTYESSIIIPTKFLGNIDIPSDTKLVVFKAPKGSGKTEAISHQCELAYSQDQPVIVLTYREQLGRELARRFKLPYKTEVCDTPQGKLFGFSLCVDSCYPGSEAKFAGGIWTDALIVIDEAESVIWHLLNSNTCVKNRLPILDELQALLTGALSSESRGRVILADADLSDLSINFVKGMAGQPTLKPFVVMSSYKPEQGWDVSSYQTPMDLYSALTGAISVGGKHIIFMSGQRVKSKWGTQNQEKKLCEEFPQKRILRIDRETVSDPTHPAFNCIDHLNTILLNYDIVLVSPVVENGVSIDLHNHFAGVWSFASGVVPTDNVRQIMARVRDNAVPRNIWLPERGLPSSFIGNGATFSAGLRKGEVKKSETNFQMLSASGVTVDMDGSVHANTIGLETWLKMASYINAGFHNYRKSVLADLEAEGHDVTRLDFQLEPTQGKLLSETMASSRNELAQKEAELIADTVPPQSEKDYERLKSKKSKTAEERQSQANYEMQQRYAIPPTPELILKDWDGWHPHLRLHYFLTVGNQFLPDRDAKRFEGIAQDGRAWVPDSNRALLSGKVKALQILGIDKLFVPGIAFTKESPLIVEIAEKALASAKDIKLFMGVTVSRENTRMAIVQEILEQSLGFRLQRPPKGETQFIEKGLDFRGKRIRERIYNFVCPEDRLEIFERWLSRDAEATVQKTVSSSVPMDHETPIDLFTSFADPKVGDPYFSDPSPEATKQETVSSSEPMDHQKPIDLLVAFSDPSFGVSGSFPPIADGAGREPTGVEAQPTPISESIPAVERITSQEKGQKSSLKNWCAGQKVKAWFGMRQCWCEAMLEEVEVNASGCLKALVKMANGRSQYVWSESELEAI